MKATLRIPCFLILTIYNPTAILQYPYVIVLHYSLSFSGIRLFSSIPRRTRHSQRKPRSPLRRHSSSTMRQDRHQGSLYHRRWTLVVAGILVVGLVVGLVVHIAFLERRCSRPVDNLEVVHIDLGTSVAVAGDIALVVGSLGEDLVGSIVGSTLRRGCLWQVQSIGFDGLMDLMCRGEGTVMRLMIEG